MSFILISRTYRNNLSQFETPSELDIVRRAEQCYEFVEKDRCKISQLIFQITVFSYIVCGTLKVKCNENCCCLIQQTDMLK